MSDSPIFISLVDTEDNITTGCEKLEVHQKGLLHRAFSILIFNTDGEMLIHQRALGKYHSAGLWTNACCGHPNHGEAMQDAVERRLYEEMGIKTELNFSFKFQYRADLDNNLIENEIDYVYIGTFDGDFEVNPDEVHDYKWVTMQDLESDTSLNPSNYTVWFKEIMQKRQVWPQDY